jgi:homoserine/homoserine lactone efflux protein
MTFDAYTLFFMTTVMLILVPGPSAMVVAAQSARHSAHQQSSRAFLGVVGIASADAFFFALSATGIASLIVASATLFGVIKWLGVGFLLYLGLSALLSKNGAVRIDAQPLERARLPSTGKLFQQGLLIQLANPKALMYFSALLPQFIDPTQPLIAQLWWMGLTVVVADLIVYSLYAWLGSHLARQRLKAGWVSLINKAAGSLLIYTGIKMALIERQ